MKNYLSISFVLISFVSISAQNIPIDFEENGNGREWVWTTFENGTNPILEIVSNPDPSGFNKSLTVAKFTALNEGQPFAGCESLHGAGIGSFTIDESSSIIRIMVWKSTISDVGIKLVRADNWSLGEIKVPNTMVNAWEQLEFDFSDHIGNSYDQIVIFPDFTNRQADNVIYFDELYGEKANTTATSQIDDFEMSLFPNPSRDKISVILNKQIDGYKIYTIEGELVKEYGSQEAISSIDISKLNKGIYIFKTTHKGISYNRKFIKK